MQIQNHRTTDRTAQAIARQLDPAAIATATAVLETLRDTRLAERTEEQRSAADAWRAGLEALREVTERAADVAAYSLASADEQGRCETGCEKDRKRDADSALYTCKWCSLNLCIACETPVDGAMLFCLDPAHGNE